MRVVSLVIAVSTVVGAVGCTDEQDELSDSSQGLVSDNRLSVNRLAVNRLAVNRLAVNRLAVNRLAVNRLSANLSSMSDLLATEEGQELLGYIVSCALPEGTVLEAKDPVTGDPLEFFGGLGLATRWLDKALDKKGKRWVSACLYARVNLHDVTVPISMRGPHRGLVTTPEELTGWTKQEGAFYGDYFRPLSEPIEWIACRGKDQAAGEAGGLSERDCAEPDPANPGKTMCGFTYAGDCGDYEPPQSARACRKFSQHGYWAACRDSTDFGASNNNGGHGSHDDDDDDGDHDHDDDNAHNHHSGCSGRATYHQVITTFTQP
ncbi:MAG: hypothetical protein H0T46_25955 [Deltaproteobacteria bacterium]|nr:hypothetical protein [Deltaproteobacteria bacterium]